MLQENNIINIASTTATTATTTSALALFSLSSQSSSVPSSPSSFTHEYDTSNYFSRLPNETVFTILAFVITKQNTVITTPSTTVYSPHKQLSILSQVCRLFYKISNDVLLWQIAFETTFDSEAIIRTGIIDIIDNNLIEEENVNIFGGAEGEGQGTPQVQNSSSFVKLQTGRNIWKELYKERQIALNKIKNYIKPTLPSPFVFSNDDDDGETDDFSTTVNLDDFMEFHFDEENQNDNENDIITNNGDSSTLDSTDQVDDNVDYQLFDFDIDFTSIGNEKDEARTEEMERNNLDFTFEDEEFQFQELDNNILEDNITFTTGNTIEEDTVKEDTVKEDTAKEDTAKEDTVKEDTVREDTVKEDNVKEDTVKEDTVKEDAVKEDTLKVDTVTENTLKVDTVTENTSKVDTVKENTSKVDTVKENTSKVDTVKENTSKVDTVKENTSKVDTVKENTSKVDTVKENNEKKEPLRENITEFDLEDNFEIDNTSIINVDGVSQDLDFVSEGLIKFDDPELDSIFASDAIELDNFVDTQDSNVVENIENDTQHNEALVKDTSNSAKEVNHVAQAQDFSNPEINGDLKVTYLQDYDESSKLLDYDESFKLPDYEESSSKLQNFDEGIPRLQDYEKSSTKFQKSQEIFSSKLSNNGGTESIDDDLPDYDENEEVSQLQDYNYNGYQNITNLQDHSENEELSQLQDFDENGKSINLQDFNDSRVESSSKEVINEYEIDLPAYEDDDDVITNLPNYEIKTNLQNGNTIIEDENYDLPDYVDEEVNLFDIENVTNNGQENGFPNRDIIKKENDDLLDYETNDVESSHLSYDENEDEMIQQDDENEIEEIDDNSVMDHEVLDLLTNDNVQSRIRTRRKIIRQNNDPELLKILDIIWKICQENDGMNSEVLLGANVKELAVTLIQSLDNMEVQIECPSIALQILSILISWHPELTIDLHKNHTFWRTIRYVMIHVDIFSESENNVRNKQLVLPASVGSAIHIFFHTNFFNLSNPSEFFDEYVPPPQLIPDSNVFNNVYNISESKPEETIIQPFGEDFSGKWCGYYLYYAYYQPSPMRESAMDITLKFSPSEPGKVYYLNRIDYNPVPVTDKVIKEFSGSGSDKHGEFVIKHGIITEKGNVNFIKTYIGRHSWIYDGILLPVGICGRWGTSSEWCGNFWIWKR